MYEDEIERAWKIHSSINRLEDSIGLDLKNSPVILKTPRQEIIFNIPNPNPSCDIYVDKLYQSIGDHDLLMKAMMAGWPSFEHSYWKKTPKIQENPSHLPSHTQALSTAKSRGYSIPDKFLTEKEVSYGEAEAYYAARMILEGHTGGLWLGENELFKEFRENYQKWRSTVRLITSQFIVPDPLVDNKVPYIIDQLWVVHHAEKQVRLLGLEVDGEYHFSTEENYQKMIERDEKLKYLGYEIYHVAGWWCRVDPYRVICEFLRASGIFPEAKQYLVGLNLTSIDEYRCGICSNPMIRWDVDWIQAYRIDNSNALAHKNCILQQELL